MNDNDAEKINFSITLGGTTYPLEYTFGGENEVDFYIKENSRGAAKPKTINGYMNEFTMNALRLQALKGVNEQKYNMESLKVMQGIDSNMIGYLLWALMLNENNVNTLTYNKFREITFRIYDNYSRAEIASLVMSAYAAGKKKQAEIESSRNPNPKAKVNPEPTTNPETKR